PYTTLFRSVVVERPKRGGGERLRAPALAPAPVVEVDEQLQRLAALLLRGRLLETDVELLRQVLEPPLNVVPVGGAERGQVRRPGVAGQLDEGADVGPGGRGAPAQPPREVAGELRGGADVRGNVAELQDGACGGDRVRHGRQPLALVTAPDDHVEIVGAGKAGPQELQRRPR